MRSLPGRNKNRSRLPYIVGGMVLLGVVLFVSIPSVVTRVLLPLTAPARQVASAFRASPPSDLFASRSSLIEENKKLREANTIAEGRLVTLELLRSENKTLRELLGKKTSELRIIASVLLRPPEVPYDRLTVDAGSADGVTEGSLVYAFDSIALGTVERAEPHFSEVRLYSSPGVGTPSLLLSGASSTAISVVGRGGGNFILELPRDIIVATGTPIVLPGDTPALLGVVGAIRSTPTDAFNTILVQVPISNSSLRFVEIVPHTP